MNLTTYLSNKMASERRKINFLQLLRFIAAFTVVACHNTFYTLERANKSGSVFEEGARGVALFFVISGFVMMLGEKKFFAHNSWKNFALQRLARITPLYWVITTVKAVALVVAAGLVLHAEFDWLFVLKSYFFLPSINADGEIKPLLGVAWTLVYEMFFYIAFTAALMVRVSPFAFCSAVMLLATVVSPFRQPEWPILIYFLCDPITINFVFGMAAAKIAASGFRFGDRTAAFVFVASLLSLYAPAWVFAPLIDLAGPGSRYATVTLVSLACFFIILSGSSLERSFGHRIPNWMLFIGASSYSLYLLHPMTGPIAPELARRVLPFMTDGLVWFYFIATAGALLSVAAGSVSYLAFEEPFTRWLQKIINAKYPIRSEETVISELTRKPT